MTLAPVLTGCHACRSPLADEINARIRRGVPLARVGEWCGLSRQTLSRHKNQHLRDEHARAVETARTHLTKQSKTIKARPGDLATLTRNLVYALVEEGEIIPTLPEGLRAQEALDRRAEKGADRDLMLVMAQVLGGARTHVPVIEGQWTQLDAERAADEAEFRQLGTGDGQLQAEPTYRP